METAIQASCLDCVKRLDRPFCDLPSAALQDFDSLKSVGSFPRGTTLFREGQPPRGIFVLCGGRAKLSVCAESGKRLTVRVAGPGEVLGLSAALTGTPYEMTAELLDDATITTLGRKALLQFLHGHREACLQVVNLLSQDLHLAYDQVRSVGLGRTRRARIH
jgi:CRP/FNR family transcriptional regulator, cyclic AMP receptor protein